MKVDEEIYIDPPTVYNHKGAFSHMTSTNIKKLHEFAESLGIKKCWFENKRGMNRPHYDVKKAYYELAIKKGAIPLGLIEFGRKTQELFGDMYPNKKQRKLFLQ